MKHFNRDLTNPIQRTLERGKSVLLLGPRQTGKTTLVSSIQHDLYINLMNSIERQRYEADLGIIIKEVANLRTRLNRKPLIIIDEIQKVPELTDNLQILIDDGVANVIITGSSARKIKNLLPGRVIKFHMQALSIGEIGLANIDLESLLSYGSLPGILDLVDVDLKEEELDSYVSIYLEEEIRKEALVRNIGAFNNFLQLSCIEAGNIVNMTKLSQEINVSHSTIAEYYRILIDCMVAIKIEPLSKTNSRRKLSKSPKYLLFDLGVRRAAAKENLPSRKDLPKLFEQFVGIELLKIISIGKLKKKLLFWRDHAGPEIDYVIEQDGNLVPIEVKWTTHPTIKDIRHFKQFNNEYNPEGTGFVVCRTPRAFVIADQIIALPWQELASILK